MQTNQHGLKRDIPSDVKRLIRQTSKFGCVRCRCGIYTYEHIEPTFADATDHDPERMCLLCPTCQNAVTGKRISKETVWKSYKEVQNNDDIKPPFHEYDFNTRNIKVVLGSCEFERPKSIFNLHGEDYFSISPSEDGTNMPLISGKFFDYEGHEIFQIINNEWFGSVDNWDLENTGPTLTIRKAKRDITLRLTVFPPSTLKIERLRMVVGQAHIHVDDELLIGRLIDGSGCYFLSVANVNCVAAQKAVMIDSDINPMAYQGLKNEGGKGIELVGTGIRLGVDCGPMRIGRIEVRGKTIT